MGEEEGEEAKKAEEGEEAKKAEEGEDAKLDAMLVKAKKNGEEQDKPEALSVNTATGGEGKSRSGSMSPCSPTTPLSKMRQIATEKGDAAGDTAGVHYCAVCKVSSLNADIEEDDEHLGTFYCDVCWEQHLDDEEKLVQAGAGAAGAEFEDVCSGCNIKTNVTADPDNDGKLYCPSCWGGWGA